ncbi:MAG: hypothetical protein HY906_20815 [Deltaproteobacteria bacterium]|nr:hypothetical protein [Deltaproteobacteria bacterium]
MSRLFHVVLACGVALAVIACQHAAGCGGRAGGGAGGAPDGGEPLAVWPAGFAPYPGARRLCSQHSTAGALRVRWTAYASADEAATVVAFYARAHGVDPGMRPFLVRGHGTTTLAVHEAAAADVPRCPQGPAPGERTVILVTTAASRFATSKEAP